MLVQLGAITFHIGVIEIAIGGILRMLVSASAMLYRWHSLTKKYAGRGS
jgi:hypothetical protein